MASINGFNGTWSMTTTKNYSGLITKYLDKSMEVKVNALGFVRSEIKITVIGLILTIRGFTAGKRDMVENFTETVKLSPNTYDLETISSSLNNGILIIHIRKLPQEVIKVKID